MGLARVVPALAVVAIGSGSFAVGSSLESPRTELLSVNAPVNRSAGDPADVSAHNSPTLARSTVDPSMLAVVNRVDSPRFSCALHVSTDAGVTWSDTAFPFPAGEESPPRCASPDLAFSAGRENKLYVSFVTLKGSANSPNAVWLVTSSDGGRTLSAPVKIGGPLAYQVRLIAPVSDRLYMSWLQASETGDLGFPTSGNPILFARSDDGGATWDGPIRVSGAGRARVLAPSMAIEPGGRLHVLYLDVGDDRLDYNGEHEGRGGDPYGGRWSLVLATSGDRGATWAESLVERRVVPTARFIAFFPPSPSLAVDPNDGRIFAGYTDGRLGDSDVWVWASKDGQSKKSGISFDPPRRVNDTPERDKTAQYLPALAVSATGRLDVLYYDRRSDKRDLRNEVSLQSSTDGARSFRPRIRLSDRPFDSRVGFGSERGLPELGSRLSLVSTADQALAAWADTRSGTETTGRQDIAWATAGFSDGHGLRSPLRTVGGAAAAVGGLALLWMLVRRRGGRGSRMAGRPG